MNDEYEFHPIAEIFPMMGDSEFQNLLNDMKANGYADRHPIMLFEGKILDGRNRYLAAQKAGIKPTFKTFEGMWSDAVTCVWQDNYLIRSLTSSQRAACILGHEELIMRIEAEAMEKRKATEGRPSITQTEENATKPTQIIESVIDDEPTNATIESETVEWGDRENQLNEQPEPAPRPPRNERTSDSILAKTAGTNRQYVSDAKKIKQEAPEVFDEVQKGTMSIPEAKKITKLGDTGQEAALKEISTGTSVKKAIKFAKEQERDEKIEESIKDIETNTYNVGKFEANSIYVSDIESLDIPEDSIDMIFTDPPYHDEHIDLYEKLAVLASKSLKPGAYCIVYCGKMFLPYIIGLMSNHLEYVWTCAVFHPFSKSKINKHHIFENWRPIVIFKKHGDTKQREWVQDVVRSVRDKDHHEWQQDEEAPKQYLSAYTQPGDIILDPFVGGGTVPYVCKLLGRQYLAFDKDETSVKISIKRVEHG